MLRILPAVAVITVLAAAPSVAISAAYVPPGLNPGDQYQLVFVTQGTIDGVSALFSDYNAFAQSEAALNPSLTGTDQGVTWNAIISADTEEGSSIVAGNLAGLSAAPPLVHARDNAPVVAPVFRLDGTKVVDDFADMWDGDIDAPINIDQFGSLLNTDVWSGTDPDGFSTTATNGRLGLSVPVSGLSEETIFGEWINSNQSSNSNTYSVYALSGVLTVSGSAVPEPSSGLLMFLGTFWLLKRRTRTRRR